MKKRISLLLLGLSLLLLLLAAAAGCAAEETGVFDWLKWNFNQKSGLPLYSGTVLAGVQEPVKIYFDDYGVPHICAANETDLIYAQGYVQAMERLFQMDLTRRLIAGRLSEIAGPVAVDQDRFNRTVGFRRAAELSLEAMSEETAALLDAYCTGVNDYIEQNLDNLPPEFILLDYIPEPWEPADTLSIAKMMAWSLGGNMDTELLLAALVEEVGAAKAAELFPSYPEDGPSICEAATTAVGAGLDSAAAAGLIDLAANAWFDAGVEGIGSNNWVVAGSRSASGGALLASDMHLSLDLPSIWYMNYLSAPGFNVSGVMFPGIPGVIAGFNDYIAWGETNLGSDVMDLYQMEFDPGDDRRYRFDGEWLEAEVIEELIKVRAGEDVPLRIRVTRFGPVISDVVDLASGEYPLSLRWTALDATREAEAMFGLLRASNFEEFREALQNFMAPAQNFVYADVDGNIGYLGNGLFPIRSESHREASNGLLPVPGWSSDYEWTGYVPWEEIPALYNPPAGLIVTANHKAVADDYPHFLTYEWAHPSRALSILRELKGRGDLTLEEMKAAQACFYNSHAAALLPVLLPVLEAAPLEAREREAYAALESWSAEPVDAIDSTGAAVFHTLYAMLSKNIFAGQVSEELAERLAGSSPCVIDRLLAAGESAWIADRERLVRDSFKETVAALEAELGGDVATWRWGDIHTMTFKHHLGDAVSEKKYNRGPFPVGGSGSTPGAMGFARRAGLPFQVRSGAPWRYVIDMSDHTAFDVLATGNSGHFLSPHYDDLLEMWLEMDYKPRLFNRAEIESLERVLVLEPEAAVAS